MYFIVHAAFVRIKLMMMNDDYYYCSIDSLPINDVAKIAKNSIEKCRYNVDNRTCSS